MGGTYSVTKLIHSISLGTGLPTQAAYDVGNNVCEAAKQRKLSKKCSDCLWNWQNVHTGKGRVCYHNTSPRYHQKAGGAACVAFETRVYDADIQIKTDKRP